MLKTILLIDDDLDDQYFFNKALKEVDKSIALSIAQNGISGLERLKIMTPDLIFLDLNMPKMNGFEFLSKIKESHHEKIHIVVYSTNISDREIVTSMGAKQCIKKQAGFTETVETIRKVISVFKSSYN